MTLMCAFPSPLTHLRLTISTSTWSTIALVHYYQYVVDRVKEANRVLVWAAKVREIPDRSSKFDKLEERGDDDIENEIEGLASGCLPLSHLLYS